MTEDRLVFLMARRLSGEPGPEEVRELEVWINESAKHRQWAMILFDEAWLEKEIKRYVNIDPAQGYNRWLRGRAKARNLKIGRWAVAAALLGLVVVGGIRLGSRGHADQQGIAAGTNDKIIKPGRNTATLTLADGQQILLDSAGNGQVAVQGVARVIKQDSGIVAYLADAIASTVSYNTLSTPRSGLYQLRLQDGSRVWLNNASSLVYPTSFAGKERVVELTGEAYFEITKDVARPFLVKTKNATVEVLGTSFNIMAYPDEDSNKTTLLAGAVQIKSAHGAARLNINEQAQVSKDGKLTVVKDVPGEDIVSWKDGFFYFDHASFPAVMRQISRWYDVEVVFQGRVPKMELAGKIDRSLPLNELLKFLDKNQIHFRLEGRKLIVLPS